MLLGPTADIPEGIANQTLALVQGDLGSWQEVLGRLTASGGALHLRQEVLTAYMTSEQTQTFARAAAKAGLHLSMESGGALCGKGAGKQSGLNKLQKLHNFLNVGGSFKFIALESVFSRTRAACPEQALNSTAEELSDYAATLASALPEAQLFLYDALPHFSVGNFPANVPKYDMRLEEVLTLLHAAMSARGLKLAGYWMDCPYEYSSGEISPLPSGFDGFKKIAKAVQVAKGMGLKVGKTFNSQLGGTSSDKAFYDRTMMDFQRTTAVVPSTLTGGYSFDHVMVETWYPHPLQAAPESTAYTTAYTARAVFRQIRQDVVV